MSELLLDAAGRRRSPATLPEFHAGRPPRNTGMRYPADPPTIEEIIAVMRRAGDGVHGRRLRGLIVVLWRAGLRICEALALAEADLDARRGSLLVRRGKGGRRREVGMDDWAWEQLEPWLQARVGLPIGPLFCASPDRRAGGRGRPPRRARSFGAWLGRPACGGASRRISCGHAHGVEMAREGVPLIVIQRQLGHTNLGIKPVEDRGEQAAPNQAPEQGPIFSKSEFFRRLLPPDTIAALVKNLTRGLAMGHSREIAFLPWGGAYNRVRAEDTAFVHRDERFLVQHLLVVDAHSFTTEHHAADGWLARSWALVHPWGSGGVYPNFPDSDLQDWPHAYYGRNYDRLLRVKAKYDPDNFFRFHQSLSAS